MKYPFFMLAMALVSGTVSCQKTDPAPDGPLTVSFQLLNEQGREATVFPQGQNLLFSYQVANSSDQDIFLKNPVGDLTHFLEVYGMAEKQAVSLGKPYSSIFCYYIGGYTLPAHQTMTLSIPWVTSSAYPTSPQFCGHAPNTYLPIGHYSTTFTPSLTWSQGKSTGTTTTFPTFTRAFDVTGPEGE
jgi:hypothetical protein